MTMNQNAKTVAQTIAVMAKTRPMTPERWSTPAARRTRIHARSMRLSTIRPPNSTVSRTAKATRIAKPTLPVQYWTRAAIHSEPAGIGPQKSSVTKISAPAEVGEPAVDAPARGGAALGQGAVLRRRRARAAADEQPAVVGGIRPHA